jgi:hypothetical protein
MRSWKKLYLSFFVSDCFQPKFDSSLHGMQNSLQSDHLHKSKFTTACYDRIRLFHWLVLNF